MNHRKISVDPASDHLRRVVEEASGMQPGPGSPAPRHRGGRSSHDEPDPFTAPLPGRRRSVEPDRVVHPSDPGDFPRGLGPRAPIPWGDDPRPQRSDDHGIGFRSTQEVTAEMSPVIYRPAGSGPEREPRKPARVPISGPDVPTAASFTEDDDPDDDLGDDFITPEEFSRPVSGQAFDDGLDEDPEVPDDELADEAEDALLDDLEEAASADEQPAEGSGGLGVESGARNLASSRRPIKQRRRRRILRRQDDTLDDSDEDLGADVDDATDPVVAATDESAPVSPFDDEALDAADGDTPADTAADEPVVEPAPRPRRRRVRTLHLSPPPTGTGADDEVDEPVESLDEQLSDDHERAVADVETPEPDDLDEPEEITATAVAAETSAAVEHLDEVQPDEVQPDETQLDESGPAPAVGTATLSGHVVSSRGRGLRGMAITVLDESDEVVGTTTTERRGGFTVDGLPAGSYRVGARDPIDGDFADGWHGAADAARATVLQVDDDSTVRGIEIPLVGRVGIDADVDVHSTKAVVTVHVIDRTTGLPAAGEVVASTEHFRTTLPLEHGHASITLFGSPKDSGGPAPELAARLRIEYQGSEHSTPANRTIRLR